MEKNQEPRVLHAFSLKDVETLKKIFRMVRFTLFCFFVGVMQLVAVNSYSQQARLSLNQNNQRLEEVLKTIEDNSDFFFIYNRDLIDVNQKVNIEVTDQPINAVLDKLLEGTEIKYSVVNRQIVLSGIETVQQKSIKVTGKVSDTSGQPLPGVTVVVKGTTNGTITNFDGVYSLSDVPSDGTIQFSFVGMKMQEILVDGITSINVVLEEDAIGIEEVVAIGYGTVRKIDLTGSVSQVKSSDIQKAPVKSFDDALAGRVAGIQIISTDGQPGSVANIIIRGANSLTQDNTPLYVVDGFPIEDNDNNSLNPADIESIDILKDASATAIYGARGANGVVIITTKRGKEGSPSISYNGSYGWHDDIKKIELMNPYEYVKLQLDLNEDIATELYLTNAGMTLGEYKNVDGIDWYDKCIRTAPYQNHSISISGGSKKTKYLISGSYFDEKGIFIETGFKRYQGRFSIDQEINNNCKIGLNVNYSDSESYGTVATNYDNGSAGASLMLNIWEYRPIFSENEEIDLETELVDPSISTTSQFRVNPQLQLENALRQRINRTLLSNAFVTYKIIPDLTLKLQAGINQRMYQNNQFNNSKTRSGSTVFPFSIGVNGSETFTNYTNFSNENTLTYNKKFLKDHKITVLAGFTQQTNKTSAFGAIGSQLPNESLGLSGIDEGTPREINSSISEWVLHSFLGRINYSYKGRYLLTLSYRADGSSKFAPGNRWAYFPSGALAYRLSEEKFMEKLDFISNLKLRGSWGQTGNNRVGDFSYLSGIKVQTAYVYPVGNQIYTGSAVSDLGNKALKWETTTQWDAGFDLGFWQNKIEITADYYSKHTDDLLLRAQIPNSSGYLRAYKNIGSISNKGVEFSITTHNINTKDFRWDSNLNVSVNRSKVLSLTENQEQLTTNMTVSGATNNPIYIAKINEPVAQLYGLIFEGTYKYNDFNVVDGEFVLKDELPSNGGSKTDIQPGDAKYKDINDDGIINSTDYTVIGNPNPDFIGGFSNNFEYKNFDLSILFQFSYGNDIFNANRVRLENGRTISMNTNQYASLKDRWSEDNPYSDIPAANRIGANFYSSRTVEDGSFLRLKTLSLGYNVPKNIFGIVKINSLRFYCSAQNLLTFTKYSGISPDVSTRHSALTPGFDISPYPAVRTITFGIDVKF